MFVMYLKEMVSAAEESLIYKLTKIIRRDKGKS